MPFRQRHYFSFPRKRSIFDNHYSIRKPTLIFIRLQTLIFTSVREVFDITGINIATYCGIESLSGQEYLAIISNS